VVPQWGAQRVAEQGARARQAHGERVRRDAERSGDARDALAPGVDPLEHLGIDRTQPAGLHTDTEARRAGALCHHVARFLEIAADALLTPVRARHVGGLSVHDPRDPRVRSAPVAKLPGVDERGDGRVLHDVLRVRRASDPPPGAAHEPGAVVPPGRK
jgi:hypothetical protein